MSLLLPDQRAKLDELLAPSPPPLPAGAEVEDDAPDWWHGEEQEAMAMLSQMGAGRG